MAVGATALDGSAERATPGQSVSLPYLEENKAVFRALEAGLGDGHGSPMDRGPLLRRSSIDELLSIMRNPYRQEGRSYVPRQPKTHKFKAAAVQVRSLSQTDSTSKIAPKKFVPFGSGSRRPIGEVPLGHITQFTYIPDVRRINAMNNAQIKEQRQATKAHSVKRVPSLTSMTSGTQSRTALARVAGANRPEPEAHYGSVQPQAQQQQAQPSQPQARAARPVSLEVGIMDSQEMQRSKSTQPSAANQTLPYPKQQLDRLVAVLASDQLQSVASSYQSNDRVLLPVIGTLADPKSMALPAYSTVKDRVQPPISEEASLEPSQATGSEHAEAAKALRKSVEGGVKAVKEQDGQITIQIDDVAADAIQRMTTTNKRAAGYALGAIGEEQAGTPFTAQRRDTWSTQKRKSVDFTSEARVDKS